MRKLQMFTSNPRRSIVSTMDSRSNLVHLESCGYAPCPIYYS